VADLKGLLLQQRAPASPHLRSRVLTSCLGWACDFAEHWDVQLRGGGLKHAWTGGCCTLSLKAWHRSFSRGSNCHSSPRSLLVWLIAWGAASTACRCYLSACGVLHVGLFGRACDGRQPCSRDSDVSRSAFCCDAEYAAPGCLAAGLAPLCVSRWLVCTSGGVTRGLGWCLRRVCTTARCV
jgi:hypothetical protein